MWDAEIALSFPGLADTEDETARAAPWKDVQKPRPYPPEFRERAVALAKLREKPLSQIAVDLGISDSCLRNWLKQADIDDGSRIGLSTDERAELVQLRRASGSSGWRTRS